MTAPEMSWLGHAGTPLSAVGEFGLIARLRAIAEGRGGGSGVPGGFVVVGIGDDAASVLPTPGHEILLTCDIQIAGRHFIPGWTSPRALGERCIAVNASDIGAMGGVPRAVIVSLAVGPEIAVEDLEELYRGMMDRVRRLDASLIGGNVSGLPSGLIVDVTMIGEVEQGRAVRRDTARAGDLVWVTGSPGSAAAGLALLQTGRGKGRAKGSEDLGEFVEAYLSPAARAGEGRALGLSGAVSSMIDVSDGLIGDLTHMVEGREVGIVLREESLPIGEAFARAAAEIGRAPESLLLGPSDDYELIFTTAPEAAERALRELHLVSDVAAWPIGEVIEGAAGLVLLEDKQGHRRPAAARGWDHFHIHEGSP